ncbi:MAG: glutathione synthase [Alphaproteobacteria bacterium]|nr:glutathione synthase [Alphaproteobacteria bacterium]
MEALETQPGLTTSSAYLMQEARLRGYEVFHYLPQDISLEDGRVYAWAAPVKVDLSKDPYYELGPYAKTDLGDFSVVWLRQHPPFDMAYITSTYILEALRDQGVLVSNDPATVRNLNDKFIIFKFPEIIPPTLVTKNPQAAVDFLVLHGEIVVKPLYLYTSKDVIRTASVETLRAELEASAEPLMLQRFIPEISGGKKRINLIDGEIAPSIVRIPDEGDFLTPAHVPDLPYEPTASEIAMCQEIGVFCQENGLHWAGIDLVGSSLIEVNVTCPGGLDRFNKVHNIRFEACLWDAIEKRLRALA